ncbi:class I SAM-dependent methyltransferase [Methylocystis echinoides]|uniref:class I SAM-dependent methyltransferase n=1 Tax=Methylocystis echinoides TaxID=29468 RepID=UPI003430FE25
MKADDEQSLVFGENAAEYAAFRPDYPEALFAWLAEAVPARGLAWDCGAGSGQAALGLSPYFDRVLATERDPRQLALAPKRPNIDYRLAAAEDDPGLVDAVDLIACACSLHWFDLAKFYPLARRALKPGGVLAAWTYDWPWTGRPALDAVLERLKTDILGAFWGETSHYYFSGYRTLPFPFPERESPAFTTPIADSKKGLVRFLSTWSAVRKYRERLGRDPLALVDKALDAAWRADPPAAPLRVPLHLRCGYRDV